MYRSTLQRGRSMLYTIQHRYMSSSSSMMPARTSTSSLTSASKATTSGGASQFIYNNIFARSPIYYAFWFTVAVIANDLYDHAFDTLWDTANQGKQFKDVIPVRFPNLPPGTEPDESEESAEEAGEGEDDGSDDKQESEDKSEDAGEDDTPAQHAETSDKKSADSVKGKDEQQSKIDENKPKATSDSKKGEDHTGGAKTDEGGNFSDEAKGH